MMGVRSISVRSSSISPIWRQRLLLLFIVACFALPLAAAWLLVGHWRPGGSAQHGELLEPARPIANLQFDSLDGHRVDGTALRGHWVLAYIGSAMGCDARCRTGLYDMRQVRLALGKDMGRVKTLLLLDGMPGAEFRDWLAVEHPATIAGVADVASRNALIEAFGQPGLAGEWMYLLDPLGNLLMRYPVDTEPHGLLKDLQRLLKWSKIG
jgi:cytochrome oxidase Cu insertion factor (SCO1/SenC/PrrC family)